MNRINLTLRAAYLRDSSVTVRLNPYHVAKILTRADDSFLSDVEECIKDESYYLRKPLVDRLLGVVGLARKSKI